MPYQNVDDFPYLIAGSEMADSEKSQQNNASVSHFSFVLGVLRLHCALEIPQRPLYLSHVASLIEYKQEVQTFQCKVAGFVRFCILKT